MTSILNLTLPVIENEDNVICVLRSEPFPCIWQLGWEDLLSRYNEEFSCFFEKVQARNPDLF